ncbi:MAG TPA: glucosaminidase domain-containing protein [Polyangiaceae bacterium]|nr:glucosaminidase domain-containing protein [Polyangiaceae bacterium]
MTSLPVRQDASSTQVGVHLREPGSSVRENGTIFRKSLAAETVRWLEPKRTQLSSVEAKQSIARAYEQQTGKPLGPAGQAILTAQWAHETAHGASMFNFNFGGMKGASPEGLSVAQRTREGYGSSERTIVDGFRAYSSAEQGAADYVQLLRTRYRGAVEAAELGDAEGFVRGLKEKGYFTGDAAAYSRSIATIANQLGGELPLANAPATQGIEPSTRIGSEHRVIAARERSGIAAAVQNNAALGLPVPLDLFRVMNGQGGAYPESYGDLGDLHASRALEMADQVTRAALRIALDGRDHDRPESKQGR